MRGSPEKENQQKIEKEREGEIEREREINYKELTQLVKLTSLNICNWQTEKMV